MARASSEVFKLHSLAQSQRNSFDSLATSIDTANTIRRDCTVWIRDGLSSKQDAEHYVHDVVSQFTIPKGAKSLPQELDERLLLRDEQRTRWINHVGWSSLLAERLAEHHLDGHDCVDLHHLGSGTLGGPMRRRDGQYFFWIQTSAIAAPGREQSWTNVRQCNLSMVICLPTATAAGTVITSFVGNEKVARACSNAVTAQILERHATDRDAIRCVWILAYSILRALTSQLGLAFTSLDPLIQGQAQLPNMDQLPAILGLVNDLARIDRYASSLNEINGFFSAARSFQHSQARIDEGQRPFIHPESASSARSALEANLAQQQIEHARQLCQTFIKQYESIAQMMLSYSTTQISHSLIKGNRVAEQLTALGVVVAAISGFTAPLNLVTSYFGMNVLELNGSVPTMFEFWKVALPVLAISISAVSFLLLRLMTKAHAQHSN